MTIESIILAADAAATEATLETSNPELDPAEVERILATLPEAAAAERRKNPRAEWFYPSFGQIDSAAAGDRIGAAVHEALCRAGVTAHWSDGVYPVKVFYNDLAEAAHRIRAAAWVATVSEAWAKRGGTYAPLPLESIGGLTFLGEDPSQVYTVLVDIARSPADVVEEAAGALKLPRWTLAGLQEHFAKCFPPPHRDGVVTKLPGQYRGGIYRPVPCLVFTTYGAEWSIDLDDALAFTAAELCDRACAGFGLPAVVAVSEPEAAPVAAKTQQEPAKPPQKPSGKWDKQRGGR